MREKRLLQKLLSYKTEGRKKRSIVDSNQGKYFKVLEIFANKCKLNQNNYMQVLTWVCMYLLLLLSNHINMTI